MRSTIVKCVAVLLGLLLLTLAGCAASWQPNDMVGSWVHEEGASRIAEMRLDSNGDLELRDVPRDVLLPPDINLDEVDWSDLVSGVGTWEITEDGILSLVVHEADGSSISANFYAVGSGEQTAIEAQLNSSDLHPFRFERQ